jgi:hypothetical protein
MRFYNQQHQFYCGVCIEQEIRASARTLNGSSNARPKEHNKPEAMSVLAAKLGRAVDWMLRRKTAFDVNKFFAC